jgi:hypothetical protein
MIKFNDSPKLLPKNRALDLQCCVPVLAYRRDNPHVLRVLVLLPDNRVLFVDEDGDCTHGTKTHAEHEFIRADAPAGGTVTIPFGRF